MALQIGTFYNKGSHYEGQLETRKLSDLGNVIIELREKDQENEPDYLIKAGKFQIGRAWKQTTKNGDREYLNVILDDPHMDQEIRARLVRKDEAYILLWERALE